MMDLREQIARAIHGNCDRELDASWGDWLPEADAVIEVLRQQEPVAWMGTGPRDGRAEFSVSRPAGCVMRDFNMQPLFLAPVPLPEQPK